jgi:hypothetical protein
MLNPSRRLRLAIAILVVTAVALAFVPSQVEAEPPCPYTTILYTPIDTGYGYYCSEATSDLWDRVYVTATAICGDGVVINPYLIITEECRAYSEEDVQVTGKLSFRCMVCDEP